MKTGTRLTTLFGTLYFLCYCTMAPAAVDWPQFRGPAGQATTDQSVAESWSETENITWKTPLPGQGWSSPVVVGNQIWLTTALVEEHSLRALCLDKTSGEIVHNLEIFHPEALVPIHDRNGHATPTPAVDEERVYLHYGTYGTAAIDRQTGRVAWTNEEIKLEHQWGPGSSPMLYRDRLFINCDGMQLRYVVAMDKATGEIVWKTDRSNPIDKGGFFRKAFSTPLLVQAAGNDLVVSSGANQVSAYDPQTGKEQWVVHYSGYAGVGMPSVAGDKVFVTTGYGDVALLAIRTDGTGDVTNSHVAWQTNKAAAIIPSQIVADGALYMIQDNGVLSCLNVETGEPYWKQRLPGDFAASPTLAGGKLYFHNNQGDTFVVKPSKEEFKQLAVNKLDGNIQASAAVSDGALFLRTDAALYRIEAAGE